MHESVFQFLRRAIHEEDLKGKLVLEVGAFDVNGSAREVILPLGPARYIGIDMRAGPGVDTVIDASCLDSVFLPESFDLVVSTEMLEHCEHWREAVGQMKRVLRPGGIMLITARGPGMPPHDYPGDFWRFTINDFRAIFADFDVKILEDDERDHPGVLFKACKTSSEGLDLEAIHVQAV